MTSRSRSSERGFNILEILIALVISLVTLMGAAGLVVRTVQQEVESYQRLQALTLAQDMVDRINVNRQVADCYSSNNAAGRELGGEDAATANVASIDCGSSDQHQRAEADLLAWHNALLGTSEQNSAEKINLGAMIGARGCIEKIAALDRTYRISVAWQGMNETVVPVNACGKDDYGPDARRRVIAVTIRMADLS